MKKTIYATLVIFCCLGVIAGCDQQGIITFQKGYSAINFATDSVSYSFLGNPTGKHIEKIKVNIMGDSAGYDRTFNVKVLHDSITTARKTDYDIIGGTVKAGQFEGVLKIKVFNSERLEDTTAALHLKIAKSKDFTVGNVESDEMKLVWTNKIIVPTWSAYYKFAFCPYPSTTAYRAIVISTGYKHIGRQTVIEIGIAGLRALGKVFGDYVRHYNATHEKPLTAADGPNKGNPINPVY